MKHLTVDAAQHRSCRLSILPRQSPAPRAQNDVDLGHKLMIVERPVVRAVHSKRVLDSRRTKKIRRNPAARAPRMR